MQNIADAIDIPFSFCNLQLPLFCLPYMELSGLCTRMALPWKSHAICAVR